MAGDTTWRALGAPAHELRLDVTLGNGQVFSWDQDEKDPNVWRGVLRDRLVTLRQDENDVHYCVWPNMTYAYAEEEFHSYLLQYFNLHDPKLALDPLCKYWQTCEPRRLGPICCKYLRGLRILKQDPFECTLAFICSSNNNIKRIKLMLNNLRKEYGDPIIKQDVESTSSNNDSDVRLGRWYKFPSLKSMCLASEERLRELGFGYRAKYIVNSVRLIESNGGEPWLMKFRDMDVDKVREGLLELPGVGPKVADCIALFSLDQMSCVPVDVHVWRLVEREYKHVMGDTKTVTKRVYQRITKFFFDSFGPLCGWAHSFLFAAELPHFKNRLPFALQPLKPPKKVKIKLKDQKQNTGNSTDKKTPTKARKRKKGVARSTSSTHTQKIIPVAKMRRRKKRQKVKLETAKVKEENVETGMTLKTEPA